MVERVSVKSRANTSAPGRYGPKHPKSHHMCAPLLWTAGNARPAGAAKAIRKRSTGAGLGTELTRAAVSYARMVTIKKFLDKSSWITGSLVASATREDGEQWRGLVTFVATNSPAEGEMHYTAEEYPTANEALDAARALVNKLFPPGAPREP